MSNGRLPITHEAVREFASRRDALVLLADAAAGDDQFLRRTALEVIESHPQGRLLEAVILKAVSDTSGYVVRTACDIVAKWEMREAHDPVLALLTRAPGSTRQTALRALSAVWRDADFSVVFQVYKRDADLRVRREAAWVLRKHAGLENWQKLFEAFSVDEFARHRQWACEIAETFSDAEMMPLLLQLTSDSNGHVRKAASRAIEINSTTKG